MKNDVVDELIKEIAVNNGITVSRDDPILILQTINNRLMQDSAKAQQQILDKFKEELENISHQWTLESTNKAERILSAALTASKESMYVLMNEGTTMAALSVREEVNKALNNVAIPLRDTRRLANLNIISGVLTLVAAITALFAIISH
ncbi:MAG: conjugal transfer protein TraM [Gammaproteobacteria bacterium]